MGNIFETGPVLLCGREFTLKEPDDIRETIRMFPLLSRRELALTICENLEWIAPSGRYKIDACRQLLMKLEARGFVSLPELKRSSAPKKRVIPGARTDAEEVLVGTVSEFAPIELEAVHRHEDICLWNEYVRRYHALGYKRPFGSHQRYFMVLHNDLAHEAILKRILSAFFTFSSTSITVFEFLAPIMDSQLKPGRKYNLIPNFSHISSTGIGIELKLNSYKSSRA